MECENNRESLVDMIQGLVQQSCGNDSAGNYNLCRRDAPAGRRRALQDCFRVWAKSPCRMVTSPGIIQEHRHGNHPSSAPHLGLLHAAKGL